MMLQQARESQFTADLPAMLSWANGVMASRPPDTVIGYDYLRRWWVLPRNDFANVYLHRINRGDDDSALHDHPWANFSVVLDGGYWEHLPGGERLWRAPGSVVSRRAEDAHRLEIAPGIAATSLFVTGPKLREWGFHCPQGWRHWREFTDPANSGLPGRGCA